MKKVSLYCVFIAFAMLLNGSMMAQNTPKTHEQEEQEEQEERQKREEAARGEHPGYFKQWFEKHKNADGIIPDGLNLK